MIITSMLSKYKLKKRHHETCSGVVKVLFFQTIRFDYLTSAFACCCFLTERCVSTSVAACTPVKCGCMAMRNQEN